MPALVLGLGGIWTELLDDVAIVPLPADAARIERGAAVAARRAAAARRRGAASRSTSARRRAGRAVGELLVRAALALVECNPVLVRAPARRGRGRRGDPACGELMHDVIVVGGGFAGVTAARECALRGR